MSADSFEHGPDGMKRNTHLLSWLDDGYTHCQHDSKEWCELYLSNAAEVIRAQDDRIASLEAERDDARRQRDEIGRAWDKADARAKEAEALAARMEKALAGADAFEFVAKHIEEQADLLEQMRSVYPGDPTGALGRDARKARAFAKAVRQVAPASLSSSKQKDGTE